VPLDGEGADQAPAASGVGEDPHHRGAPFDLLVQAFEPVDRLEVLVVLARQPLEDQRLFDVDITRIP
jgi:hypothetical protein